MEIRSCSISWEPREAGGQIQAMGSRELILSGYEQMQASTLPLCFFFPVHHPNASSSHLWGLLAPNCRKRPGRRQVGAQQHVVQASQGCFHHLQARLVWALCGV